MKFKIQLLADDNRLIHEQIVHSIYSPSVCNLPKGGVMIEGQEQPGNDVLKGWSLTPIITFGGGSPKSAIDEATKKGAEGL